MKGEGDTGRRSRAGLSTLKRHRQKRMGPWSYALMGVLLASMVLLVLFLAGWVPLWVAAACFTAAILTYVVWDKKTDPINDSWGEGARGEARVGAELQRLHEQGFHVFHDWQRDEGKGNVDHFVVGPQGVFAIETKAWNGKITAEGDNLARIGYVLRGGEDPLGQARGNAWKVHELVEGSSGVRAWVTPVLCFTKAEVACYGRVGNVEVTTIGSLNRVLADPERPRLHGKGWEGYSPQEVRAISRLLEKKLGVGPAAAPGLPPEEPTRGKRLLGWFFGLPDSVHFLMVLGGLFFASLVFPAQASKVFFGVAYLYHRLGEAYSAFF